MSRWISLPKKSRRKCRDLVLKRVKRTTYIVRCPETARWRLSSRLLRKIPSFRCDGHKNAIEMAAGATAKSISESVVKALSGKA